MSNVLMFGRLMHYGFAEPVASLRSRTTGEADALKWQCIAD